MTGLITALNVPLEASLWPSKGAAIGTSSVVATTGTISYTFHTNKQNNKHEKYKNMPKKNIPLDKCKGDNASVSVITLHGFGGSSDLAQYYDRRLALPEEVATHAPDFNCSTKHTNNILSEACFAQDDDIKTVFDAYKQEVITKGNKVIIRGVSNGAAAAATFAGTYDQKNTEAIVLESPYSDVENVISNIAGGFRSLGKTVAASASLVSKYNPYGIRPIDVVDKIQKNIPVLFICSKGDTLIPAGETIKLYTALKKAGHTKTHLVVLDKGAHANLLWGPEGHIYLAAEHAFYKKYGLPHNADLDKQYDIDKQ